MRYWLIALCLLFLCGYALPEGQKQTGSFTISGTTGVDDAYIDMGAATTNYGSIGRGYLGRQSAKERKVIVQFNSVADSLASNVCDSARMSLTFGANLLAADWAWVYPIRRKIGESHVCWNYYDNIEGNLSWTTAGAYSAANDYRDFKLDSFQLNTYGSGQTGYFDVTPIFDSGWLLEGGQLVVKLKSSQATNNVNQTIYMSDTTWSPTLQVWWTESSIITKSCAGTYLSIGSGADFYNVTSATAPSFNCTLDSMRVELKDLSSDTVKPLVYKNFANDSSFLEKGTDTVATTTGCQAMTLRFAGTTTIVGDSSYFFGVQVGTDDATAYGFCTTNNSSDTGYYGLIYPDSVAGTKATTNCQCFTAYLTEKSVSGAAQVIIISKRWENELIFDDGNWFRRIADGIYRYISDPVFGG